MTIATTIISREVMGAKKVVFGYSTNDSTGGEIVTGLNYIEYFGITSLGSSAVEVGVNEVFPLAKGEVTIVTESGKAINWMAVGR